MRHLGMAISVMLVSMTLFAVPVQGAEANLTGTWQSSIGFVYEIMQSGNMFSWKVVSTPLPLDINEKGEGTLEGNGVKARYKQGDGPWSNEIPGKITKIDEKNRAKRIEWGNGVVFFREDVAPGIPGGMPNVQPIPFTAKRLETQPLEKNVKVKNESRTKKSEEARTLIVLNQSKAIKDIGIMIGQGRPLKEVKGRWETLIKVLAKGKASVDVHALEQQAMQEANAQLSNLDSQIAELEEELQGAGDDAQLANIDLQNLLQEQQRILQMMSNISKTLHDQAMAIIRKMN